MSTENIFYDSFYSKSGWHYNTAAEKEFMSKVLIPLSGWKPQDRVIEIGAGNCLQAELLRQSGFDVTAIEASQVAVDKASKQYPDLKVVCADAGLYRPSKKGHVYARGMSWYHYELDGVNKKGVDVVAETANLFDNYIAPGHTMVMQIITDFSGRQRPDRVHMNTLESYEKLFSQFGKTKLYDWSGNSIRPGSRGVIVVTTKNNE